MIDVESAGSKRRWKIEDFGVWIGDRPQTIKSIRIVDPEGSAIRILDVVDDAPAAA
jgi:hypothetical protein